jgi:disulfide bond formation protein DsbB
MNLSWTHVHLLLNHFPIVGAMVALIIFIIGMARKIRPLKQASYWLFILMALLAIPVYYSGTQAYATVESLPNVQEALIYRHREVAEWSFIIRRCGVSHPPSCSTQKILPTKQGKVAIATEQKAASLPTRSF